jgi:Domain of unknown function DUF11
MVRSAVVVAGAVLVAGVLAASASVAAEKGVETHSDFGVTMTGPDDTSVGGRATYEMEITNAGPDSSEVKLRFNRGKGASAADFDDGESVRTVSQTASKGKCDTDADGVICRPGSIDPGETVEVEVVLKVFDDYMPKLRVQATVAPELVPLFDTNHDNDHAEVSTKVRAPITVDGLPDGCANRPFKVAVKTDVPKGKKTKVLIDGKVLDTSSAESWKVTVKPDDLARGSHTLSVVVQGGTGGALASLEEKFKTC